VYATQDSDSVPSRRSARVTASDPPLWTKRTPSGAVTQSLHGNHSELSRFLMAARANVA
jgi:hypothetical protein